jgi:peptidoglycan/xylan/chitin deacetylase (PgdA/CDA1 family)
VPGSTRGRGRNRPVPILMYHQVTQKPTAAFAKYTVTAKAFAAQMRWLAVARYTPLTLEALVEAWQHGRVLPRRPVVITFDDGFRDCMEYAVPVLRHHRFPAVFFLVAGLMGRTSEWMVQTAGVELPLMDWGAARALESLGMECAAHSMTHPALADQPAAASRAELVDSRRLLEDRLGREVRHLAYPFGSVSTVVRDLAAEAGYVAACTTEHGLADEGNDRLLLPRVPVYGHDSLLDFVFRLRGGQTARQVFHRSLPPAALSLYRKLRGREPHS